MDHDAQCFEGRPFQIMVGNMRLTTPPPGASCQRSGVAPLSKQQRR